MSAMTSLAYRKAPVPKSIRDAAGDAAAQCGYDQFEEELLHYKILNIRWVSADSVKAFYPESFEPPCAFAPDEIVSVDWKTWAVPKRFNGCYEDAVIERIESIVVAASTLIDRKVLTYGLGPEYNWLEWEGGSSSTTEIPVSVFKALCELIKGNWRDSIQEYAEGDANYLDDIHPRLQAAVAKAIGKRRSRK